MKRPLLAAALVLAVLPAQLGAAGSIQAPGTYGAKKLITKLDHKALRTSSAWKLGEGEPPIGPGKAAQLAIAAQELQFPEFRDAAVKEVSLIASRNGCYYRVMIWQEVDMAEVAKAGGRMKPNQMFYYVLLDSTVVNPTIRD